MPKFLNPNNGCNWCLWCHSIVWCLLGRQMIKISWDLGTLMSTGVGWNHWCVTNRVLVFQSLHQSSGELHTAKDYLWPLWDYPHYHWTTLDYHIMDGYLWHVMRLSPSKIELTSLQLWKKNHQEPEMARTSKLVLFLFLFAITTGLPARSRRHLFAKEGLSSSSTNGMYSFIISYFLSFIWLSE